MTVNLNHTNKFKNFLLKITQLSPERIIRQDHQNRLFDKRKTSYDEPRRDEMGNFFAKKNNSKSKYSTIY